MKRGLVIGKFMPLHEGHIALIRFAKAHCDELIVSMTYRINDPIPGPLRYEWIKEEFKNDQSIKPFISLDDFDNESLPLKKRIPMWSDFLRNRFPQVDFIFSSEDYGDLLAKNLGAEHISFDKERLSFPASATFIRKQPFHYWNFISAPAKAFFVKKICLYGPESTGKSTMAKSLAYEFQTEFVPEVSREIVTSNEFTVEDIIKIGRTQTERVLEMTQTANRILFCDTDLITTQIYCRHYLGTIPPILFELEKQVTYDAYYLFDIDVPWVADDIRDLGDRRQEMLSVFKTELEKRNIPFIWVRGSYEERKNFLMERMNKLLSE